MVLLVEAVSLPYVYMPGQPDSPGSYGTGVLLWMDDKGFEFERDAAGRWGPVGALRLEDGNFDLSWSHRCILLLIRHGWVEAVAWDERMSPTRVKRTAKPGLSTPHR